VNFLFELLKYKGFIRQINSVPVPKINKLYHFPQKTKHIIKGIQPRKYSRVKMRNKGAFSCSRKKRSFLLKCILSITIKRNIEEEKFLLVIICCNTPSTAIIKTGESRTK
jgi:hypothetical protein